MLSDKECSAQRTCLWLSVSSCLPGHTAQEVSLQWGSGSLTGSLKESFSFINVRDTVIITGGVFWILHEPPTKKGNILGGYIIQAANWRAFPALVNRTKSKQSSRPQTGPWKPAKQEATSGGVGEPAQENLACVSKVASDPKTQMSCVF